MKKVLLGVVALVVLYLCAALALSVRAASRGAAHNAELTRLAALGDAAAAKLDPVPLAELNPLGEACQKLPRVEHLEILAYFPQPAGERITAIPKDSLLPSREVFGIDSERYEVANVSDPWRSQSVTRFLEDLLGDVPTEWGWRSERWNEPFHHPLTGTKYLVVHALAELQPPTLLGKDAYEPGVMRFRSVVLDAKSGAVLCSGHSVLTQHGDVHVAGSGKTKSEAEAAVEQNREGELMSMFIIQTHFFALGELCSLGGKKLCELTFGAFRP